MFGDRRDLKFSRAEAECQKQFWKQAQHPPSLVTQESRDSWEVTEKFRDGQWAFLFTARQNLFLPPPQPVLPLLRCSQVVHIFLCLYFSILLWAGHRNSTIQLPATKQLALPSVFSIFLLLPTALCCREATQPNTEGCKTLPVHFHGAEAVLPHQVPDRAVDKRQGFHTAALCSLSKPLHFEASASSWV